MMGDCRTPFDLGVVGQRLIWEGCRLEIGGWGGLRLGIWDKLVISFDAAVDTIGKSFFDDGESS
jgi:hypothetical protein